MSMPQDRRTFLKSTAAFVALSVWPLGCATTPSAQLSSSPRKQKPAVIRGGFFYPPAEDVLAGKAEDGWAKHQWFTWPGNQFEPEAQQAKFLARVRALAAGLDLTLALEEKPLCTDAGIRAFLQSVEASKPDALLLFNFWNSFSAKLKPVLAEFKGPIILYHPVGANHQLPPEYFRTAPRVHYVHSIENWPALERGLRAVHTRTRMAQSRLLRVSGQLTQEEDTREPLFGTSIHGVPAEHFNALYDQITVDAAMERMARSVGSRSMLDAPKKPLIPGILRSALPT